MTNDDLRGIPSVEGVLSAADVRATAASIAALQHPDGSIPWAEGEHTDVWNHVEAAMAMLVGGEVEAAERAYQWCLDAQREDGSWAMKYVAGVVEDPRGEANMCSYLAVGVWHHWLLRQDRAFVDRMWPAVRRGLDWVTDRQLPFGGLGWSHEWDEATGALGELNADALLAGSSSIYQSLRAGVALADLVGDPQPAWELAGGRLRHALREHRDLFLDKSTYSMDWYYPVLGGAVRGEAAYTLLAPRWDDFVVPDLGIRCVDTNPWVTGAETCELVMALDAIGDHERARRLLIDMQHLRAEDGSYWTGYVWPDEVNWPPEFTTYTAAAVILAVDALAELEGRGTPGSGIMRGDSLAPDFADIALECGCPSGDPVPGVPAGTA
ncbi:prenyltransferase [Nocardioides pacificus]